MEADSSTHTTADVAINSEESAAVVVQADDPYTPSPIIITDPATQAVSVHTSVSAAPVPQAVGALSPVAEAPPASSKVLTSSTTDKISDSVQSLESQNSDSTSNAHLNSRAMKPANLVVTSKSGEVLCVDLPHSPSNVSDGMTPLSKCNSEMIMNSPIAIVQEAQRGFAATKAAIKFNDSLDQFGLEIEVPNEQVANLEKQLRGRSLLQEIDRVHGISPALKVSDARVLKVTKSLGSTIKSQNTRSSIESLQNRLKALEACGQNRIKEVKAITELWTALQTQVTGRMSLIEEKVSAKPERLGKIEGEIVERLTEELKSIQAW
ncbi:hypothetical protein HDU67_001593 [Dinochytrium kinnereticum]|nr:hypothetical protein HDU67_001593 [Dinochytrium kinnereticum]